MRNENIRTRYAPMAYFMMHNWLMNYPYRISIGPWIFIAAAGITFVSGLAAVISRALKAALMNPVGTLRYE